MTRDEAIKELIAFKDKSWDGMPEEVIDVAIEALKQESKTGHWIYSKAVNTSEIIWSECSECKDGERGCAKRMKYCPNCGAKMQEIEE